MGEVFFINGRRPGRRSKYSAGRRLFFGPLLFNEKQLRLEGCRASCEELLFYRNRVRYNLAEPYYIEIHHGNR